MALAPRLTPTMPTVSLQGIAGEQPHQMFIVICIPVKVLLMAVLTITAILLVACKVWKPCMSHARDRSEALRCQHGVTEHTQGPVASVARTGRHGEQLQPPGVAKAVNTDAVAGRRVGDTGTTVAMPA
jgi:hypothetical protein